MLNLRNAKWLLNCSYNPYKNVTEQRLAYLDVLNIWIYIPQILKIF